MYLKVWSPVVGGVWGDYGAFRMWSFAEGTMSLGQTLGKNSTTQLPGSSPGFSDVVEELVFHLSALSMFCQTSPTVVDSPTETAGPNKLFSP